MRAGRLTVALCSLLVSTGQATSWSSTVWADEFNGPVGVAPDPTTWTAEVGGNGWGNQELEFYTDRRVNSRMDGQGHLMIEVRKEAFKERDYTSARLITKGKYAHAYGRFEARIKLPRGQGIWPAFWIMGDNIEKVDWPNCGEVDILEVLGHEPGKLYGTMHGPGYSGDKGIGTSWTLTRSGSFADDFHVFAIEWTRSPAAIRWFIDETCYQTLTPKNLKGKAWVFNRPFFILLNVAVGGDWPGAPDPTTVFPQQMLVDWVRVRELPGP